MPDLGLCFCQISYTCGAGDRSFFSFSPFAIPSSARPSHRALRLILAYKVESPYIQHPPFHPILESFNNMEPGIIALTVFVSLGGLMALAALGYALVSLSSYPSGKADLQQCAERTSTKLI